MLPLRGCKTHLLNKTKSSSKIISGCAFFGSIKSFSCRRTYSVFGDPYDLANAMVAAGKSRGFVVTDPQTKGLVASHECFEPVKEFLSNSPDYLSHEGCFFGVGPRSGALLGAFLWNTQRGAAGGGIRLSPYKSVADYVTDGLRLATGMGRKSALTGLWHGGGKGVIAKPHGDAVIHDQAHRKAVFEDYGEFITSLRGCYIAAEDSGVNVADMDVVFSKSRFTTCISPELGGSGNPSVPTAAGVAMAMEGAITYMEEQRGDEVSDRPLEGKSVAIQGCGNVGRPLIGFLLEKGVSRIVAADISSANISMARDEFGDHTSVELRKVDEDDTSILAEDVDIVSPCAWGGVLNPQTTSQIKEGTIVCGAANAQLLDPADDCGMTDRGVIYVPDFCANPMGIVNCANEAYGRVGTLGTTEDPMISDRLGRDYEFSVYNSTRRVLALAAKENISTAEAANKLADNLCEQTHPIFGHRSQEIINSLLKDNWADEA